jgi:hypothetical protein
MGRRMYKPENRRNGASENWRNAIARSLNKLVNCGM